MNDRFKCRAIDVENGEWHYGYYAELPCGLGSSGSSNEYADTASFILCCIKKQSSLYSNAEPHEVIVCEQYRIVDKTLSQCTGIHDKNGKLIYEGDILKTEEGLAKVEYYHAEFVLVLIQNPDYSFVNWDTTEQAVIGNIYKNPELLEENNANIQP